MPFRASSPRGICFPYEVGSLVHWLIELMNLCLNQDTRDLGIYRIENVKCDT